MAEQFETVTDLLKRVIFRGPDMTKAHDELIGILAEDHEEVKGLLNKLEKEKGSSKREELVKKLYMEIEPHMTGEEEAFYPSLKKTEEGKETALEALEEHHVAKTVLNELMDLLREAGRLISRLYEIHAFKNEVRHERKERGEGGAAAGIEIHDGILS